MIILNDKEVKFEQFPNGETLVPKFDKLKLYLESKITFKYEDDSDLIKLMFLKKYLDDLGVLYTYLTITYMPYSRMDRNESGNAFTLKYISEFVNNLDFTRVTVIEPHSDVTPALLDNVLTNYVNFDLLENVMDDMGFDKEKDYIVFPDNGASKRYHNLTGYKYLVGYKNRDFETGKIKNLQIVGQLPPSTEGSKVLILDDLSSRGGTFVHTAKALNTLGFDIVNLLVAHAENTIFKGELFDCINHVYTTNSLITEQDNWENAKYKNQLTIYDILKVEE